METLATQYKEELLRELGGLPSDKIREILDFVCSIKAKGVIDPSQAFFWTRKWQDMEREAYEDKKAGNIVGNGTVEGLLRELKT